MAMQYLVLMHHELEKNLITTIHHKGTYTDDWLEQMTFVDSRNLRAAAEAAHKHFTRDDGKFGEYRAVVIPLSKSDKLGPMEFIVTPPTEGAVITAVSTPRKKK